MPTSVWSKTSPVDIHQIYTRLSWVKEEQTPAGSSRSELNHYTDVFTANKNGVVPKRILVQGQTGIGKSTFVKKLAVDWAELDNTTTEDKQKDILKTFELLVVVNLKEVSKCQSLKDVISCSSIFARKDKHLTDSLLNYISNNEDKVLLVFDGYDEYRCGSNSEIYEVFRGNKLRNCCVLITTRISKADELRPFKYMHAEITGFSEDDRKAFMSKMLDGEAEAGELGIFLELRNLLDLAKIPLLLLFFCTLWKKGKLENFTKSKTELYLAIIQYVLDYNQGKDCPAHFGKVHGFEDVLTEIGKVALQCLLKDDHVFEYDQLSAAVLCDESVIVGLLQVSEYAENLRPAGMVSFIHKSIQEFLAAWFVTYRCVPEGNLGGIEQHARTLDDYVALENVFQFVCGLSDDGAVKVFQHLSSVRISDPTLDLSKTIPDVENETDVPLCDVTDRQKRFSELVHHSFLEVQSKATLVRHWLDSTAGIILITDFLQLPQHILKMTLLNEAPSYNVVFFRRDHFDPVLRYADPMLLLKGKRHVSMLYDVLEFFGCLHVPLRITENSSALLIGDFLRQFKTVGCENCCFDCILRFHNGKAQFYITDLELRCYHHARLFTETIAISTPSRSTNLCSKQSCLKFLRYLSCVEIVIAQAFKDLGAVFRNCKHLKTIQFERCGDAVCELLDQIPNSSTCSLKFGCDPLSIFRWLPVRVYSLTSVGAEKLAGVLPRFNITALRLNLHYCCAAAVNKLVCSITHKTLRKLALIRLSLTPAVAAALGRSLPKMSSLESFELTGIDGNILQAEVMELLFGGFNKTMPLQELSFGGFNVKGCLTPLTKSFHFFSNLRVLRLEEVIMDHQDLFGLLKSLRFLHNLETLCVESKGLAPTDSSASEVNTVNSVSHRNLKEVRLTGVSLTPTITAMLGQLLPKMSSLTELELTGLDGSVVPAQQMERLFDGFTEKLPLWTLDFSGFSVRGCLAPLTRSFSSFPNLNSLSLENLNMDEHDLRGLLESFRFIPNLMLLDLSGNPLGHAVTSIVPHVINLPKIRSLRLNETCSGEDLISVFQGLRHRGVAISPMLGTGDS